jgi:hypothetical protein
MGCAHTKIAPKPIVCVPAREDYDNRVHTLLQASPIHDDIKKRRNSFMLCASVEMDSNVYDAKNMIKALEKHSD